MFVRVRVRMIEGTTDSMLMEMDRLDIVLIIVSMV